MIVEPMTSIMSRTAIFVAIAIPSCVILSGPIVSTGVPGVKKRLKLTEIRRRIRIPRRPRTIYLKGTFVSRIKIARNTAATPYIVYDFTRKSEMRKSRVPSSFTRGSSRWITESTG